MPERTSSFRPVKSVRLLKLTTPDMASEPYTAEAPPVMVSTPLEDELRNQVDVDHRIRVRQRQAPAIEQHEIACFTQTTQVERRASRERDGADGARRLALHELRQLIHRLFDVDRAALRDGFFAVRHDGAGRGKVRTRDARAGDHDFIDLDGLGAGLGRGLPEG